MVNFEVSCYYKDNVNKLIGAEVIVSDDGGNAIDRILITDAHGLEQLREKLDNLSDEFLDVDDFKDALKYHMFKDEHIEIDATLLDGQNSSYYATADHNHGNQYAPYSHQSNNDVYGSSTTEKFGHSKIRDDLTSRNLIIGEALSGRQGYELNQKILDLNQKVTELENSKAELEEKYYKNSLRIKIGRWSDGKGEDGTRIQIGQGSGDGIYAKLYCDDPNYSYSGRTVILLINNVPYEHTTDKNGKTDKRTINLGKGRYVLNVFIKGEDGINPASELKILEVL